MNFRELVLEDFKAVDLPNGQVYLSARRGIFEITLEEHLTVGYTIGIYEWGKQFLAIEKKSFMFRNHPAGRVPEDIQARLILRALEKANLLLEKYADSDPSNYHILREQDMKIGYEKRI